MRNKQWRRVVITWGSIVIVLFVVLCVSYPQLKGKLLGELLSWFLFAWFFGGMIPIIWFQEKILTQEQLELLTCPKCKSENTEVVNSKINQESASIFLQERHKCLVHSTFMYSWNMCVLELNEN